MTEAQLIHDMARVHWWSRHSASLLTAHPELLEGQEAEQVEAMWAEARDTEIAAMQNALRSVTLLRLMS